MGQTNSNGAVKHRPTIDRLNQSVMRQYISNQKNISLRHKNTVREVANHIFNVTQLIEMNYQTNK